MKVFRLTLIGGWLAFAIIVGLVFILPKIAPFFGSLFFLLSMSGLLLVTALYKIIATYKTGMARH
jgi:hypothetical protein